MECQPRHDRSFTQQAFCLNNRHQNMPQQPGILCFQTAAGDPIHPGRQADPPEYTQSLKSRSHPAQPAKKPQTRAIGFLHVRLSTQLSTTLECS